MFPSEIESVYVLQIYSIGGKIVRLKSFVECDPSYKEYCENVKFFISFSKLKATCKMNKYFNFSICQHIGCSPKVEQARKQTGMV